MGNKIDDIKEKVTDINSKLEQKYVTQDQFEPIRKIAYGLVAAVVTLFLTILGIVFSVLIHR